MNEKNIKSQGPKPKISILAIASMVAAVLGVIIGIVGICKLTWCSSLSSSQNERISGLFILTGFILGIVALVKIKISKGQLKGLWLASAAVVLSILAALLAPAISEQIRLKKEVACGRNLFGLGKRMMIYANIFDNKYPTPDKWCDLLIRHTDVNEKEFICPSAGKGPCHYAINPNCEPNSPNDVVLLFETKRGWNQLGGQELLTFEHHSREGCLVLFNDGHVEFVRRERFGELKWGVEKDEDAVSRNCRRPGSHEELKYWLENMVWYHRFTNEEISAATALAEKEIVAALEKFDILPDNRPKRAKDAPLLVLPYPGGRHPRIGFLEGAIDPQRETKFSVFTPWDVNSYVVVDVPEAIWSNLGLTYLAHKHIDTIWTKQGNELPKLEWNRHSDGGLDIERKLPNGIVFGVKVKPTKESVRMEMWLKNGTDEKLSDLRVQNCVMTKMAADFEQQTNDNKVFTNPYVACRSSDGKRWIITAWENCHQPWGNEKCPCFHSDPKFPDAEPGQTHRLRGWLSFYEGTDIEAEFKRIEETGWRKK